MQAGKVDVPSNCAMCGANLSSDRARTCGEKCRKEFRRWARLHHTAQGDLYDAAKAFGELLIACDEAGGVPPPEVMIKAARMVESAAVAYTIAASKVGKLPEVP